MRKLPALLVFLALAALTAGCTSVVAWTGIRLLYDKAPEPAGALHDLPYREGSEHPKHRLDLFPSEGEGWPVLVFLHGGGWQNGDKGLVVSGADVYGNIGRFYASQGIGTAVVNYRLQPEVGWPDQLRDVAHAVAWVSRRIADYGGDPESIFLIGHSAGAWLTAYTALNPEPLGELELGPDLLCGAIPVSGVAYDLTDQQTYEMGAELPYYEERLRNGDPGDDWLRDASVIPWISPRAPPFLLIYGSREWKALGHQHRLLDQALREAGVSSRLVVAKQTHESMVLALSRPKNLPSTSVLDFVRNTSC